MARGIAVEGREDGGDGAAGGARVHLVDGRVCGGDAGVASLADERGEGPGEEIRGGGFNADFGDDDGGGGFGC